MKGKKTDIQFVSDFITQCVTKNITSPNEILQKAKDEIADIDKEIIYIENRKIIRSKLLDVVSNFELPNKNIKEIKLLSFFQLTHPDICKFICNSIKESPIVIDSLKNTKYQFDDIVFCVKQLLECKIISKIGNNILRGDLFDDYVSFVLNNI